VWTHAKDTEQERDRYSTKTKYYSGFVYYDLGLGEWLEIKTDQGFYH